MILIPSITLARPADALRIAKMSREHIEYGLGWSWTEGRVRKAIQDDATNVAVLHEASPMAGFGIMCYGERKAHLLLLCVAPTQRKRGFGGLLLGWLEKCALTAGLETVQLEARADNAAVPIAPPVFSRSSSVPAVSSGMT